MPSFTLTGKDILALGPFLSPLTIINDFGDGDNGELTYPNELSFVKTGKGGNSIYSVNASGLQSRLMLRILRGSATHKRLLAIQAAYLANPPGFILLACQFTKLLGDGAGNTISNTIRLSGGVPDKLPDTVSNVEGNTDQALGMFSYKFTGSVEVLQ